MTQIQLIINGYSPNKIKLMNCPIIKTNPLTTILIKSLMMKKLSVMLHHVMTKRCNGICLNSMIWPALHWFQAMLGHPGTCGMCATLQSRYHQQHLHMHIENSCVNVNKQNLLVLTMITHFWCPRGRGCSHLHWAMAYFIATWWCWFYVLTCIDTTTNLVNLTRIFGKSSRHIAKCFAHDWLSQ